MKKVIVPHPNFLPYPANPRFIILALLVIYIGMLMFTSCNNTNKHKSVSKLNVDSTFTSSYDSVKTSRSKSAKQSVLDTSKIESSISQNDVTIYFGDTGIGSGQYNSQPVTIEKKDGKTTINLGGRLAKIITDRNFNSDVQTQKAIVGEKAVIDNKESGNVSKNQTVDLHKKEVTQNNDKSTHRFSWWWLIPVVIVAGLLGYNLFKKGFKV